MVAILIGAVVGAVVVEVEHKVGLLILASILLLHLDEHHLLGDDLAPEALHVARRAELVESGRRRRRGVIVVAQVEKAVLA